MRYRLTSILATALAAASVSAQTPHPAPAPTLAGAWVGTVTSEMGEMAITATFSMKAGVVTGTLETGHGAMSVSKGALTEGKWVLPFTTSDGGTGLLTGTIKDDVFSGEWDYRPMALGTFSLKRTKAAGLSLAPAPPR